MVLCILSTSPGPSFTLAPPLMIHSTAFHYAYTYSSLTNTHRYHLLHNFDIVQARMNIGHLHNLSACLLIHLVHHVNESLNSRPSTMHAWLLSNVSHDFKYHIEVTRTEPSIGIGISGISISINIRISILFDHYPYHWYQ